MPDDTFRPRRPTNPPDDFDDGLVLDEDSIKHNIAKHLADQRAAGIPPAPNVSPENLSPDPVLPLPQGESSNMPVLKGNVPPEFQKIAAQQRGESAEPSRGFSNMSQNQNQPQPKSRLTNTDNSTVLGNSHLKEVLEQIKGQSTAYEEIELPSLGRFYDGTDGPTNGILSIRKMTGEEEQILATPNLVRKGQAINMIFQRCIRERYNPEKFLTIDRTYLLIYLRGISYTPYYEVEVKCPECDKKFPTTIHLNELYVESCPDDYGPELQDVLPKTNLPFSYRLSRGQDEQEVSRHRDQKMRAHGDSATDDTLTFRTAQLVNHIDGIERKEELQVLLKHLPISDVSYLRNCINEPPFGVDTNIEILCPSCMHDFGVDLPLEAGFFFPRHKRKTQA